MPAAVRSGLRRFAMSCSPMPTPIENTCDCHAHVFADPSQFPLDPSADYTPPVATAEHYQQQLDQLGIKRCVLVQPSVYGTDNSALLAALDQLGSGARGVAVIALDTPTSDLQVMHRHGVRGIRLNTLANNGPTLEQLPAFERCIDGLPWHLQVLLRPQQMLGAIEQLEKVSAPLVLDHFASYTPETSDQEIDALFALAQRKDNLWIKLSAPYLFSDCSPQALDGYRRFSERAIELMPERLLWGTDWPHTARRDVPIDAEQLYSTITGWIRDNAVLRKITVDNPAALYQLEEDAA